MLDAVCSAVNIPVIASGGAGKIDDFSEVFEKTGATAALAASLFHFKELTVGEVKDYCRSKRNYCEINRKAIYNGKNKSEFK